MRSRPCRRGSSLPFEAIAGGPPGGSGHRELAETVNSLDRELLGAEHPDDHRFLRAESRQGFLYRGPDGAPLGYGYAGEVGRVGPIAIRDGSLLEAVIGHLATAVPARGARAVWAIGGTPRLVPTLARRWSSDRWLPADAVLGPSVCRLRPLPTDLAGPALAFAPVGHGRTW